MCVIAINKGSKITFQEFEDMWLLNRDGLGMMYLNAEKQIIIKKTIPKNIIELNYFYDQVYCPVFSDVTNTEIIIHFRYATDGDINKQNCHPFKFSNKNGHFALMHNGVMPSKYRNYSTSEKYVTSDTVNFIEDFLKVGDFSFNEKDQKQIIEEVGYNKLVILSPEKLQIINEHLFYNHRGNLFSNLNWFNRYHSFKAQQLNFFN